MGVGHPDRQPAARPGAGAGCRAGRRARRRRGSAPPPAAQTYTVEPGDTLWAIAERFYGDGNRYQEIATASGIDNPDAINPGQVLTIP